MRNYIYFHKCPIADESSLIVSFEEVQFVLVFAWIKLLSLYLCILLKTGKKFILVVLLFCNSYLVSSGNCLPGKIQASNFSTTLLATGNILDGCFDGSLVVILFDVCCYNNTLLLNDGVIYKTHTYNLHP